MVEEGGGGDGAWNSVRSDHGEVSMYMYSAHGRHDWPIINVMPVVCPTTHTWRLHGEMVGDLDNNGVFDSLS